VTQTSPKSWPANLGVDPPVHVLAHCVNHRRDKRTMNPENPEHDAEAAENASLLPVMPVKPTPETLTSKRNVRPGI
jgi:hypothetical protein